MMTFTPKNNRPRLGVAAGSVSQVAATGRLSLVALAALVTGCTNVSLPVVGTDPGNAASLPETSAPPTPDSRGVISFPNYQAVRSRQGETITEIATRLEVDPEAMSLRNGLPVDAVLRDGELLLLPERVPEEGEGLAALVSSALLDSDPPATSGTPTPSAVPSADAPEPVRHIVERGETAYSIARLYNVSVRALADWNGLPPGYEVREGQTLVVPLVTAEDSRTAGLAPTVTAPGEGTPLVSPPSAASPLPQEEVAIAPTPTPPAPAPIAAPRTEASDTGKLAQPVQGRVLRAFEKGVNDGVDFGAEAGAPVVAAQSGTVVAITRDVDQVSIIVIRHPDNMLTVYANVDAITVAKDAQVSRGQQIASVLAGDPSFLHFEVRVGFDSVDPLEFF